MELDSLIVISVYHTPQTKKKSKRRILVASARASVGELLKRREEDGTTEIRLSTSHNTSSQRAPPRVKPGPASLIARLCPPPTYQDLLLATSGDYDSQGEEFIEQEEFVADCDGEEDEGQNEDEDNQYGESDDGDEKEELFCDAYPVFDANKLAGVRGYWSGSDVSDHDDNSDQDDVCLPDSSLPPYCVEALDDEPCSDNKSGTGMTGTATLVSWLAASILPQYTERPQANVTEADFNHSTNGGEGRSEREVTSRSDRSTFASATPSRFHAVIEFVAPSTYLELCEARLDSEFERVLIKVQREWYQVGTLLVALAGLNLAVFGLSSGSLFSIDGFALKSTVASGMASGLGLAFNAWFLLAYNADVHKFRRRAMDVYGTYFFFSVTARVPALCMFISAIGLMAFMMCVAWTAWPAAVLATSFVAGIIVSLQFIVYGVHCTVRVIVTVVRSAVRVLKWALRGTNNPAGPGVGAGAGAGAGAVAHTGVDKDIDTGS